MPLGDKLKPYVEQHAQTLKLQAAFATVDAQRAKAKADMDTAVTEDTTAAAALRPFVPPGRTFGVAGMVVQQVDGVVVATPLEDPDSVPLDGESPPAPAPSPGVANPPPAPAAS